MNFQLKGWQPYILQALVQELPFICQPWQPSNKQPVLGHLGGGTVVCLKLRFRPCFFPKCCENALFCVCVCAVVCLL